MGLVHDLEDKPLSKVLIHIKSHESGFERVLHSDSRGGFRQAGLSPGRYLLSVQADGYQAYSEEDVTLEPGQTLHYRVFLAGEDQQENSFRRRLLNDPKGLGFQTVLDETQILDSPSGHNVWFLVENQDLSATTNRIDVGGLWTSLPGRFSARGGTSWTQTRILLNGMDISNPFQTGMPLLLPDVFSLSFTRLINAALPVETLSPGGYFDLITRDGKDEFEGRVSAFTIIPALQSSNISPALQAEGLYESHSFNSLFEGNVSLSGPVIPGKLTAFSSFSVHDISRNLADFEPDDRADVFSGLISLRYRLDEHTFRLIWNGQRLRNRSYGAGRDIPFAATNDRKDVYNVFQALWTAGFGSDHAFKAGLSLSRGETAAEFQEGLAGPHIIEVPRNIPAQAAAERHVDDRTLLTLLFKGDSFLSGNTVSGLKLEYGFQVQRSWAETEEEVYRNLHLRLFEGHPLAVVKFDTPLRHSESGFHLNTFLEGAYTLPSGITLFLGLNIASSRGWMPDAGAPMERGPGYERPAGVGTKIQWFNLSPRLGLVLPLTNSGASALKVSLSRYYSTLPLNTLTYGNPRALGGLVYSWSDANRDGRFQTEETGILMAREGPFFSAIDEKLKRPFTDELTVSYDLSFGSQWRLVFGGFFRDTRNLIETVNTGVPFSSYEPETLYDIGDDRIPDNYDDLILTVYNQSEASLGQDYFLLTNAFSEERKTRYYGLDLTLVKKYSDTFLFFLSLTATQASGPTNPGNTEWENDDGIIGALYDDPNTLIYSDGRVRFDRAYTGRLGFHFNAPWGIKLGLNIKYYDGQPFTRKIIVRGFNQGPFFVQAFPRGVARYEYNRTVEIRIEKTLRFGRTRLRLMLDGFNVINRGLATEENEWTGPEFPLRFATDIQSPRVFRLGMTYEF